MKKMKKLMMISVLGLLVGCAELPALPGMGPKAASTPATPVFFQPFSAALDQPALSTIASAAQEAQAQPGSRVVVTGAADGVGSPKANKYLSETRAQVVADALVADGVARGRIKLRAAGAVEAPGGAAQAGRRALIQIEG
jgi:outer membrane protein OmpA-like peptidoglycan-associated protein